MTAGEKLDEERFRAWKKAHPGVTPNSLIVHALRAAFLAGKAYGFELRGCCEAQSTDGMATATTGGANPSPVGTVAHELRS